MRASCLIGVWVLAVTSGVSTAGAQGRGGRAPAMEPLSGEVTVMTVRPGMLEVMTQDRVLWVVSIPTRLENVVFRGPATPQFLQPGMAVRFHTTFRRSDKRQKEYLATRPVSELEIITVSPNSPPDLYPENAADQADGPSVPRGDAPAPRGEKQNKAADKETDTADKAADQAADQGKVPASADDMHCLVIGIVTEHKNNKIKVQAGQFPVTAELPETATVSVDVRHCLWVRPGDKVELTARYYPARRGWAEGQEMTIATAVPLAPDEKATKGRRRTRDKQKEEVPKKGDDQGQGLMQCSSRGGLQTAAP